MTSKYWIALFTIDTWAEFRSSAVRYARFPEHRLKLAQKIKSGDLFIFYLTGFSRFVGFGYAESPAFMSFSPNGVSALEFPVLVKVRESVECAPEFGLPIHDLLSELSPSRDNSAKGWRFLVRVSPTQWPVSDGSLIVERIKREQLAPMLRPLEKSRRPVVNRRNPFSKSSDIV